jgi:hypothetical protein
MLSIVVSWRDRREVHLALPGLLAAARAHGGDVTLVDFGGRADVLAEELRSCRGDVRIVQTGPQRYFNKSCAQNLGAAHTIHPLLFFCDADIVLDAPVVSALVERVSAEASSFATIAGVRESVTNARRAGHVVRFGYELRLRTADGRELCILDHEEDAEHGTRQAPGLLMVRRSDFLAIDGYNARLHGWGWEDQDMIGRLTLGLGLRRISEGVVVHVSHDDEARIGAYPPTRDRWESRDRMFRTALANYDRGDFQGSYRRDVAETPVRCHVYTHPRSKPVTEKETIW